MLTDKAAVKQVVSGLSSGLHSVYIITRIHRGAAFRSSGGGRGRNPIFWGQRNVSSQEISWSNYRAWDGKLFVPPFITLIDKTGAVLSRGRGEGVEPTKVGRVEALFSEGC